MSNEDAITAARAAPQSRDFTEMDRMALMLLSQDGKPPFMRMLDGRKLISFCQEKGGKMFRRQDLEQEGADVFCSEEFLRKLLADLRIEILENDRFYQFPGLVSVAYADVSAENPDPEGKHLKALLPVTEWWMSERAKIMVMAKGDSEPNSPFPTVVMKEEAPCDPSFGLFIEYMCVHQPPYADATERTCAEVARLNLGVLYGHARTALWRNTQTPTDEPERQFSRRGWCVLPCRLASMLSPAHCSLDISAFASRESQESFAAYSCTASSEFGTAAGAYKTTEQLAAQSDTYRFGKLWFVPTLTAMMAGTRVPPVDADGFEAEVRGLVFPTEGDAEECVEILARATEPILRESTRELEFAQLTWELAEWRRLGLALRRCDGLQRLTLSNTAMGAEGAIATFGNLGAGELPALTGLYIPWNAEFGAAGSEALGGAFARGAMANLEELIVMDCGVTAELLLGLPSGSFPKLKLLKLFNNEGFGEAGGSALAGLIRDGGLGALESLDLTRCNVTGSVMAGLPDGALPRLAELVLMTNGSFGEAGCSELMKAVHRGAMASLQKLVLVRCGLTGELFAGMGAGALATLEVLELSSNKTFGDGGCEALGGALERGALPGLQELFMIDCNASAKLLARLPPGSPPKLFRLMLWNNPTVGDAGAEALKAALERGALPQLTIANLMACGLTDEGRKLLGDSDCPEPALLRSLRGQQTEKTRFPCTCSPRD